METTESTQQVSIPNELPNSTAVLVLGIISITTCWCWGAPGLACGIVALVLASKGEKQYNNEPNLYKPGSYSNLKAGKICAIIGICLSGITFLSVFVKLIFGAVLFGFLTSILPFLDK